MMFRFQRRVCLLQMFVENYQPNKKNEGERSGRGGEDEGARIDEHIIVMT